MSSSALSPVARRRAEAVRPPAAVHDVELRPLAGTGAEAMIVRAADLNFLPALLADLAGEDWRTRLAARLDHRRGVDGRPELSPAIHRRFQLVLLEAVCRVPGFPPVDPEKLVGMGMVLRRESGRGPLAWTSGEGGAKAWARVADGGELDPDPKATGEERRPRSVVALEKLLAERRGESRAAEDIAPLHLAPPEVNAARGKTILFGVLPLSSAETTAGGGDLDGLTPAQEQGLTQQFSLYLKRGSARTLPRAGQTLDAAWRPLDDPAATGENGRLYALATFLRQLDTELGLEGAGAPQRELRRALRSLRLPTELNRDGSIRRTVRALDFVRRATPVLVAGGANAAGFEMPLSWPAISSDQESRLLSLARACLTERFAEIAPDVPKFDDDDALYRVRAFVRVEGHAHCPPRLVWGPQSERFRIRPWWDSDATPARVSLPSIGQARNLKPGVAFEMPPSLANLLQGDMKKLAEGEASGGGGLTIGWLCSFSIPIITLCAFIVLNIFLTLFNLIFGWILWVRICLPYPKRSDG